MADVGSQAAVDAWLAAAARLFPSSAQAPKCSADADLELYAEPGKATADRSKLERCEMVKFSRCCRLVLLMYVARPLFGIMLPHSICRGINWDKQSEFISVSILLEDSTAVFQDLTPAVKCHFLQQHLGSIWQLMFTCDRSCRH